MMKNHIDFRYLKAFQLTAHYLNFSKAARELNIAQSAISRQIKLLEESMQEQLIIRSSKKVVLTEKGKELLKAIGQFEEITNHLVLDPGKQLIRVGILHGLLENWFIKIIKDFNTRFEHELEITVDTPTRMKEKLIEGRLDIIFTNENIQSDLITSLNLFEERLVIISKKEIEPKNLQQYNWIAYDKSDYIFKLSKKASSKIFIVKSITAMIKLVKESVGVALVPFHTVKEERLKFYETKGVKTPNIYLSTLNFQTLPSHLQDLVEVIKKST